MSAEYLWLWRSAKSEIQQVRAKQLCDCNNNRNWSGSIGQSRVGWADDGIWPCDGLEMADADSCLGYTGAIMAAQSCSRTLGASKKAATDVSERFRGRI